MKYDIYNYTEIQSEKQLDEMLQDRGYTKYVGYEDKLEEIEKKYPELQQFKHQRGNTYSHRRLNEYFGYLFVDHQMLQTSYFFNRLINEMKRKDD